MFLIDGEELNYCPNSWSSTSKTAVTKQKSHHEVTLKPKKTKDKQRKEEYTITQCFGHVWSLIQTFMADFFFFGFSLSNFGLLKQAGMLSPECEGLLQGSSSTGERRSLSSFPLSSRRATRAEVKSTLWASEKSWSGIGGMSPSGDIGLSTSIPLSRAVTALLWSATIGSGWGWGWSSLRSSWDGCLPDLLRSFIQGGSIHSGSFRGRASNSYKKPHSNQFEQLKFQSVWLCWSTLTLRASPHDRVYTHVQGRRSHFVVGGDNTR